MAVHTGGRVYNWPYSIILSRLTPPQSYMTLGHCKMQGVGIVSKSKLWAITVWGNM